MFQTVALYTNQLKQLRRFYMNVLELEIADSNDEYFIVNIGSSQLIFKQTEKDAFYHYAINIPGNQFSIIKHQLKERLTLNKERGIDEVYFSSFDADSMYFEDPAGNIIELIGRRKRDLFGNPSFKESFINISEVGIVTEKLEEVSDELQDIGIPLRGVTINPNSVNFLGRDDTFIVLVRPGRRWYFSEQTSEIHPLEMTLTNKQQISINEKGNISISSSKNDGGKRL